jgi:hypothetical protein
VFPQNHGYNPTDTVGALAYWAADAIGNRYLKNPGPLVWPIESGHGGSCRLARRGNRARPVQNDMRQRSWIIRLKY